VSSGKADEAVASKKAALRLCSNSIFCSSLADYGFPFSAEIERNTAARILLCPWVYGLWASAVHLGPLR